MLKGASFELKIDLYPREVAIVLFCLQDEHQVCRSERLLLVKKGTFPVKISEYYKIFFWQTNVEQEVLS
ncbi:hypothetical protein SNE40_022856 [Patella caerulea]|uniref:Uncharacterized protein n=1 Tax=Patella caerulea TaxID=87958 RepID=A0AAN8IWA6_PATCE